MKNYHLLSKEGNDLVFISHQQNVLRELKRSLYTCFFEGIGRLCRIIFIKKRFYLREKKYLFS